MKPRLLLSVIGVATVLVASPRAEAPVQKKAAQQTVAIADLPSAVTTAIEKSYPGSTIVTAAKMARGTQVRYELSVKPSGDGAAVPVMISPEGVIAKNAKGAPATGAKPAAKGARKAGAAGAPQPFPIVDLPGAVVKSVKDAYPKDTITSAMKETSGAKVFYVLALNDVSSAAPMHVTVSADGQIQKR
jgi:hypothetical protein